LIPSEQIQGQATRQIQGPNALENRHVCQICERTVHAALDYYHQFDFSYQGKHPLPKLPTMVVQSKGVFIYSVALAFKANRVN